MRTYNQSDGVSGVLIISFAYNAGLIA